MIVNRIPGWLPIEKPQEPIMVVTTALIGDVLGLLHTDASPLARRVSQELHRALERATLDALEGKHPATADEAMQLRNDYRNGLASASMFEQLTGDQWFGIQREHSIECAVEEEEAA